MNTTPKLTDAQRSRRSERRRLDAGGRNVRVLLPTDAAHALSALQHASGMTAAAVIASALKLAAEIEARRAIVDDGQPPRKGNPWDAPGCINE